MAELSNYDAMVNRLTRAVDLIPTRAGTVAVNFVKERFRAQNWLDTSSEPWQKRKRKKKETRSDKRAILVKSARLMRSIRKISANRDRAIIGTDVPYARLHNEGGKVQAVASIGSYTKKASTRKRKGRTETVKAHTVKAHRRTVNFTMPQRQFIGNSATLNRRVQDLITNDITKALTGL